MTSILALKQLFFILGLAISTPQAPFAQDIEMNIKVFLEGPYNKETNKMNTKLHDLGYLPGMKPKSFFGIAPPFYDPYDGSGGVNKKSSGSTEVTYPENTVDWVQVLIRDAQTEEVIYRHTAVLLSNGKVQTEKVDSHIIANDRKYEVIVQHRNHLPVQSPELKLKGSKLEFDFTKASDAVALKSIGKVKAMYAGNIYSDARRKVTNMINDEDIQMWRAVNGKNSSYFNEDVDLNGDVSVHDQSLILENLDISSSVKINE